MKAQALSTQRVRNAKKKTVQISSFSFLGKEQEMGCDRIISKKSLPPLHSVEKKI